MRSGGSWRTSFGRSPGLACLDSPRKPACLSQGELRFAAGEPGGGEGEQGRAFPGDHCGLGADPSQQGQTRHGELPIEKLDRQGLVLRPASRCIRMLLSSAILGCHACCHARGTGPDRQSIAWRHPAPAVPRCRRHMPAGDALPDPHAVGMDHSAARTEATGQCAELLCAVAPPVHE